MGVLDEIKSNRITLEGGYKEFREVNVGNTGRMFLVISKDGKEYYFKPAETKSGVFRQYRAEIQEAASILQQYISPETAVKCNTITIDGMYGAIQEKIEQAPNMEDIEWDDGLIGEYIVDYCLCNYDSHKRNFIKDKNGHVRGIDKEQSFRYIYSEGSNRLKMDINFNADYYEEPPIYGKLISEKWCKLCSRFSFLDKSKKYIERLESIPEDEYRELWVPYAKAKDPEGFEALLEAICKRREFIIQKFQEQYRLQEEQGQNYNLTESFTDFRYEDKQIGDFFVLDESFTFYGDKNMPFDFSEIVKAFSVKQLGTPFDCEICSVKNSNRLLLLYKPSDKEPIAIEFENFAELKKYYEKIILAIEFIKKSDDYHELSADSDRIAKSETPEPREKYLSNAVRINIYINIIAQIYSIYGIKEEDRYMIIRTIRSIFDSIEENDILNGKTSEKKIEDIKNIIKQNIFQRNDEFKIISSDEEKKVDDLVSKLTEQILLGNTIKIATPDELILDGKPLPTTRQMAEELIKMSNISSDPNNPILDFNKLGYEESVQDILLKIIYNKTFSFDKETKAYLHNFKLDGFQNYNFFLRGQFDKLVYGVDIGMRYKTMKIDEIVKGILVIGKVLERLPTREYDIVINRLGAGYQKSTEVGSKINYDSLVSFGTNKGTELNGPKIINRYQRVLKKSEPAIPFDLMREGIKSFGYPSETEMLTLPFTATIKKSSVEEGEIRTIIELGDIEDKSLIDIIEQRLTELVKYLQNREGESEIIQEMLEDTMEALEIIEKEKTNPSEIQIETSDLEFFDDGEEVVDHEHPEHEEETNLEEANKLSPEEALEIIEEKSKVLTFSQIRTILKKVYTDFKMWLQNLKDNILKTYFGDKHKDENR